MLRRHNMLEFFDLDNNNGYVSFYTNYLLLNKNLVNCFADAYRVRLACDKEAKKIYLFKLSKDEALSEIYSESSLLKLAITKSYGRISQRSVIEFVENAFSLTIPKNSFLKFNAKYLPDEKAIVINMKEEIK